MMNAQSLKGILDDYCAASGQMVSPSKSSIFFSPNTDVESRLVVCETLDIMTEAISDKYLGLPAMLGVDKVDCFKHLVERILKLVTDWKERTLSYGGKEVLIK